MTCPRCSALMRGPVRVSLDAVFGQGTPCYILAERWTCSCGCVVVMPVGEGRT